MLYLPLFSHVESIEIGVDDSSSIYAPRDYKITKPVVFYGSSITNGAASVHPGITYPAVLSRKFGFDFVNLGFGGGCRGETEIADYISKMQMSVFVYGYDHNAINAEELEERHERFFKLIREENPDLPILILSKPDFLNDAVNNAKRRDVIYRTYSRAQASGDENVYFIDGARMYGNYSIPESTVDGIHPKDYIFEKFAQIMSEPFELMLKTNRDF